MCFVGRLYGDFLIGDDYIYNVADPLNPLLVGETAVYGRIIGIRDLINQCTPLSPHSHL